MKIVVSTLAAAGFATLGMGSAAQAAIHTIDFSANAQCPASCTGITYTGTRLGTSTAIDLDGSTWEVTLVGNGDDSGLVPNDSVTITPHSATYGNLSGAVNLTLTTPLTKTWTDADGTFIETLTTLTEVDRGRNQIGFTFTGTVSGGDFTDAPATLDIDFTQAGGPGNVVSASLTNFASTTVTGTPEPATWAMMLIGFAGLGYAAVRRGSKNRTALVL
jgi:PEP-CTERM motif